MLRYNLNRPVNPNIHLWRRTCWNTYFEYVLDIPEHKEKCFKVQKWRIIHEDKQRINPNYLRKKVGVQEKKTDVYLAGKSGIRGIVNEILFLNDGTGRPRF